MTDSLFKITSLGGHKLEGLCFIRNPTDVMSDDYPSETFRVLKNNEIRQFGPREYRTLRLVLEA